LVDNKESLRIYIAVDSKKVSRCKWCGTTQSDNWIGGRYGGIFCSTQCSLAYSANGTLLSFLVLLVVLFPILFGTGYPIPIGVLLYGFAILAVIFIPLTCFGGIGYYYRMHIPKDSRRDDVPIDVAMLKTMSSAVLCPRCDANIDVSKVGADRIYTCDYCGASGTIEIMNTSQSSSRPFSLSHEGPDDSTKESIRVRCTLCGAVYSYKKSSVSEGSLTCQNCGKTFKIDAT
jgi:transcription elongation factor Elf1